MWGVDVAKITVACRRRTAYATGIIKLMSGTVAAGTAAVGRGGGEGGRWDRCEFGIRPLRGGCCVDCEPEIGSIAGAN